ncbi:MAG: hypothetical protein DRJ52_00880 [Thermoprotei archaeon]|nr:MAG: hypothetical protein DRJ52_00880 [Thermoprotei archaeon]RLE98805.1 MAG: hypothetical protein DRJ63_07125 [Thermoprotei archaeon]HDI75555.1 hypothetical protein [Thermoprotei archaeon]
MRDRIIGLTISMTITLLILILSQMLPLEKYLSTYSFYLGYLERFSWYPFWRLAVFSFLYWLFSVLLFSAEDEKTFFPLIFSSILFTASHYLLLLNSGILWKATFYPFIFSYRNLLYLDWGQISLATLFACIFLKIKKRLKIKE